MTEQSELVDRLRSVLAGEPSVREVAMFGGKAFMVNDKLVVSAHKDGSLLVRVAATRHDEMIQVPGASGAVMGPDRRNMGPGWISVTAEAIAGDERLTFWVGVALEHNCAVAAERETAARTTTRPAAAARGTLDA